MLVNFLKKFIIVTVFLSFANCQIALAANWNIPIDWSKVKKISNKTDLATFLENKRKNGETFFPIILTKGLTVNDWELRQLCPSAMIESRIVHNDGQNIRMLCEALDYPGTRVANAYLKGNTDGLNQDELKLYNIAVKIIEEAKKKTTWQAQEVYFYNEIAKRTTYYTEKDHKNQPHFVTAFGALVKGKANCQGYTDAFYMLGKMMGWDVGRMIGKANNGWHMWNTITFTNGRTYCVDVTWGDSDVRFANGKKYNSYIYLNAPVEIMQVTHSWDYSLAPKTIQGSIDDIYSYCAYNDVIRLNSAEAGLKLLAKKIAKENKTYFSVMVPFSERYYDSNTAANYLAKEIDLQKSHKREIDIALKIRKYGKYLFYMVDASSRT